MATDRALQSRRRRVLMLAILLAFDVGLVALAFSPLAGVIGIVLGFLALACVLPTAGALWRAWRAWRRAIEAAIDDDFPLFI